MSSDEDSSHHHNHNRDFKKAQKTLKDEVVMGPDGNDCIMNEIILSEEEYKKYAEFDIQRALNEITILNGYTHKMMIS